MHAYPTVDEVNCYLNDQQAIWNKKKTSVDSTRLYIAIPFDSTWRRDHLKSIHWWGYQPSDWIQIKLSIDIHCYRNFWRSICTTWRVFIASWRNLDSNALVLGTILVTIDCVYLQLPSGNPHLAALRTSQSAQWPIHDSMTSIECACFTARLDSSHGGWFRSWNNLRSIQFAPRCTRSEWYM